MSVRIVVDGRDPITAPALEYLESLGIPAKLIRRIEVDCPVGGPQLITATLMVEVKVPPQPVDEPVEGEPRMILKGPPHAHLDAPCTAECWEVVP